MKRRRKYLMIKDIIILIIIILMCYYIGTAVSKYVLMEKNEHIQTTDEFYFQSDIADIGDGMIHEFLNWDGNERKIEFCVQNYKNTLLKTEKEITYDIKTEIINAKDIVDVSLKDEDENVINGIQTLSGGNFNSKKYFLYFSPKEGKEIVDGKEFEIKVTISSKLPYTKDLISNIKVRYKPTLNYEAKLTNSNDGDYVILNLKINNAKQNIEIQYNNSKIIVDKSNNIINDLNLTIGANTNSFIIPNTKLEKGRSYEIYFSKIVNSDVILGTDIKIQ